MIRVGRRVKFVGVASFPRHKGVRGTVKKIRTICGAKYLVVQKDTAKKRETWHPSFWQMAYRSIND